MLVQIAQNTHASTKRAELLQVFAREQNVSLARDVSVLHDTALGAGTQIESSTTVRPSKVPNCP